MNPITTIMSAPPPIAKKRRLIIINKDKAELAPLGGAPPRSSPPLGGGTPRSSPPLGGGTPGATPPPIERSYRRWGAEPPLRRWGADPPPSHAPASTTRHGKNTKTGRTPTNKPTNTSTNAHLNVSTGRREKSPTKKSHHKRKYS